MSDIPLAWMIRELELLGEEEPSAALKWCTSVHGFKSAFRDKKKQALSGLLHDSLSFGTGTGIFTVLLWKLMGKCGLQLPGTSELTWANRIPAHHQAIGARA